MKKKKKKNTLAESLRTNGRTGPSAGDGASLYATAALPNESGSCGEASVNSLLPTLEKRRKRTLKRISQLKEFPLLLGVGRGIHCAPARSPLRL